MECEKIGLLLGPPFVPRGIDLHCRLHLRARHASDDRADLRAGAATASKLATFEGNWLLAAYQGGCMPIAHSTYLWIDHQLSVCTIGMHAIRAGKVAHSYRRSDNRKTLVRVRQKFACNLHRR